MAQFRMITRAGLDVLFTRRDGETRLGERVQLVAGPDEIKLSPAKFVLLGIPEDIGVRANYGIGGTSSAWLPALSALLSVQSGPELDGSELLVLGGFDFSEEAGKDSTIAGLRQRTAEVDEAVAPLIEQIAAAGKIPLVIGGGHNNAFPVIKGVARGRGAAVNVINLDAHSDYRREEGRHSGNGFRYARSGGWLNRYAALGLHRNYNSSPVMAEMERSEDILYRYYEDIFITEQLSFREAVAEALKHTSGAPRGVELDLDCIEGVLSSAMTPAGISSREARQYISWCAAAADSCYLHIAEGAVRLENGQTAATTAKLIAYLITDFMRGFGGE